MKTKQTVASALALAAFLAAGPASADRGGRDDRGASDLTVTRQQAEATARAEGLVALWEIKARRGVWKLEGATAEGGKIEVTIDGDTGNVLKREVYRAFDPDRYRPQED